MNRAPARLSKGLVVSNDPAPSQKNALHNSTTVPHPPAEQETKMTEPEDTNAQGAPRLSEAQEAIVLDLLKSAQREQREMHEIKVRDLIQVYQTTAQDAMADYNSAIQAIEASKPETQDYDTYSEVLLETLRNNLEDYLQQLRQAIAASEEEKQDTIDMLTTVGLAFLSQQQEASGAEEEE